MTEVTLPWLRYQGYVTKVTLPWLRYQGYVTMVTLPWLRYHGYVTKVTLPRINIITNRATRNTVNVEDFYDKVHTSSTGR